MQLHKTKDALKLFAVRFFMFFHLRINETYLLLFGKILFRYHQD
jgi:hypothetical protein